MDIEEIRNSYRPNKIKILLVGESPPVSGKFFYMGGPMTAFTLQAIEKAYNRCFVGQKEFLNHFKSIGCFLDDLSHIPVNHLKGRQRERMLQDNIECLAYRIRDEEPEAVIAVFKRIGEVRQAVKKSGVPAIVYVLYPPGNGH